MIGNKVDTDKREVTAEEAMKVAQQYEMCYYETSARLNKNITEAITSLVKDIYVKLGGDPNTGGFGLSAGAQSGSSGAKCCG